MRRIAGPGATQDNRFTEGNAASGLQPTMVTADWCNDVQEEIVSVITGAGIALDGAKQTQLRQAITAMIAANIPASPGLASAAVAGLVRVGSGLAIDGSGILSVADVLPVGSMVKVFGKTAPAGTLKCNGGTYSRTTYSRLFQYLVADQGFTAQTFTVSLASPGIFTKTSHGFTGGERLRLSTTGALPTGLTTTADYFVEKIDASTFYLLNAEGGTRVATSGAQSGVHSFLQSLYGLGDGIATFNVPDERGEFSRGWDDGRGVDVGRVLGSWQRDQLQGHRHALYGGGKSSGTGAECLSGAYTNDYWGERPTSTLFAGTIFTDTINGTPRVGSETLTRNRAHLICIKY